MIHSIIHKCCHSKSLPPECCAFCNGNGPETLLDICFDYILTNLHTICEYEPHYTENLRLRENVTLPVEICEKLLYLRSNRGPRLSPRFVNIFRNQLATKLKRVKLYNTDIDDDSLKILLQHRLISLDVSHSPLLTANSLKYVTAFGSNLTSLSIGDNMNLFPASLFGQPYLIDRDYVILAPRLKRLSVRNGEILRPEFYMLLLKPLTNLTHLDLSNCSDLGDFHYVLDLINLTSLILYNVNKLENLIPAICKLKNLRHLDISQSKDENGTYENPSKVLATIVECLPRLTSLDISGTNLAGSGVAERTDDCFGPYASDIPGLSSRVHNKFQFLGLYETQRGACFRHDIPAKLIAGNANEEQVLVAALAYLDRSDMLQKVLNELFHLFRFESCNQVGQALNIVLEAMNRNLNERHIQISGSATLFYIVKGAGKELHDVVRVKRRIITTLLNGMCAHRNDDTMMRNGCLTLCQFKVPLDVVRTSIPIVRKIDQLILEVLGVRLRETRRYPAAFSLRDATGEFRTTNRDLPPEHVGLPGRRAAEDQIGRSGRYRLSKSGCFFSCFLYKKMLWLIADRLKRGICDDVLEVAWSTMWNVTDETPLNCQKFLEHKGMEYFLKCLKVSVRICLTAVK
ncbi:protein zer-1 [Holotrichia oblita]|uniref:Protein zer-1 n=1 Tax=Holotrichia oblita TaxID=644536 RepID=A0ACB9TXY3_HOLOL|nr:protein zer-1 [Holotrichia oblita]